MTKSTVRDIAESLGAAVAMGGLVVLSPLLRPWYRKWGAQEAELQTPLPGDERVPEPRLETTRAVTVQAPPEQIWPWLAQLGQSRGGWYSYERLENLAGCDIHNADQILPKYQDLSPGDRLRLGPEGYPFFTAVEVDPGRSLVLMSGPQPADDEDVAWGWVFVLEPVDGDTTRLIARNRVEYPPTFGNRLMWRGFVHPVAFVMERRMLHTLRERAESMNGKVDGSDA